MKYRQGSHTVYNIQYHFVFVTKYRYKVLKNDIAYELIKITKGICEVFEIEIISEVVSPDHVHIIAPSEIMRRIKGKSERRINELYRPSTALECF